MSAETRCPECGEAVASGERCCGVRRLSRPSATGAVEVMSDAAPSSPYVQTDRGPEVWFSEAEERAVFRFACSSGWLLAIARAADIDKAPPVARDALRRVLKAYKDRDHYATSRPGDDW